MILIFQLEEKLWVAPFIINIDCEICINVVNLQTLR